MESYEAMKALNLLLGFVNCQIGSCDNCPLENDDDCCLNHEGDDEYFGYDHMERQHTIVADYIRGKKNVCA